MFILIINHLIHIGLIKALAPIIYAHPLTYNLLIAIADQLKIFFRHIIQMNLKIQIILLSLFQIGDFYELSQSPPPDPINNPGPTLTNIAIMSFGIFLILCQTLIWRKLKKQRSMISFTVFNKADPVQISSSYDQSHNDFSSAKNETNNQPEGEAENESPGIKTIKGMTEKKEEGDSIQGQRQSQRRRRKRKADKLSDRRTKPEKEDS